MTAGAGTSTLIVCDELFLQHDPGPHHPETPSRLRSILDHLDRSPVAGTVRHAPRAATDAELLAVHGPEYLTALRTFAGRVVELDPDTVTSPRSFDAAVLGAGAAVDAVERVWGGQARNAFVLSRPPGHHAESTRAMGFCLFNNVAVAAEAARRLGAERVLIVDWDVHHGNGTQHHFQSRRDVLFMSAHQYPFYPGTGAADEIGVGAGAGFTVNCALPPSQDDADYGAVFDDLFLPIASAYRPDLVLVSAGFDAHALDPLGEMRVTERGFAAMCAGVKRLAEAACAGKLVLLLEGGYDLGALPASVRACLEVMTGRDEPFPPGVARAGGAIEDTRAALRGHWRL